MVEDDGREAGGVETSSSSEGTSGAPDSGELRPRSRRKKQDPSSPQIVTLSTTDLAESAREAEMERERRGRPPLPPPPEGAPRPRRRGRPSRAEIEAERKAAEEKATAEAMARRERDAALLRAMVPGGVPGLAFAIIDAIFRRLEWPPLTSAERQAGEPAIDTCWALYVEPYAGAWLGEHAPLCALGAWAAAVAVPRAHRARAERAAAEAEAASTPCEE